MSRASLLLLAGALWLGCLHPGPWWSAPLAGLGLLTLGAVSREPIDGRSWWRLAVVAAFVAAAGAGLAGGRDALRDEGPLAEAANGHGTMSLEATVVAEPRSTPYGAWMVVRVTRLAGRRTHQRALLQLDERDTELSPGDRLRLRSRVEPLDEEGFHDYVRSLGAAAALRPSQAPQRIGQPPALLRASTFIRRRARHVFEERLPPVRAALLAGLVTGDRSGVSDEQAQRLADAGLSHLVVVSGRHVALLLAGVLGLAGLIGAGYRGRRYAGLLALVAFVVLVRWEPSVLRAAVMASLVLVAGLAGRGTDPAHALGIAVVVLLLIDPLLASRLGFVLSVLATGGVLLLAPRIIARMRGPRWLGPALAVTCGAQLAVSPVLLDLEGSVGLGALPANLLAGPAAAVAQGLGLAAALLVLVWPTGAALLAALAGPAVGVILTAARLFADAPRVGAWPLALLSVTGLAVLHGTPRLRRIALAGLLAQALWTATAGMLPPERVDTLRLVMLDIGQGDALLVEAPRGDGGTARLLVDGGPDPRGVRAELRERRIHRLDAVVLTHGHDDHSGGLPAVIQGLDVGALLVGPVAPEPDAAPSVLATWAAARTAGVPILPVVAGKRFRLGKATVHVLGPPSDRAAQWELNDRSVVLRIDGAHGRILLPGDAEETAQAALLRTPASVRATVLKLPHHGGATNHAAFLDVVDPTITLISVGRENDYGHPAAETLDALRGRVRFRSDRHGTVSVTLSDPPRVSVTRGRPPDAGYTAAHAPPARVPAHRQRGAAAPPGGGAAADRVGWRRLAGRHGRAGHRPARGRAAGSAHRLALRRSPCARDPCRP